jgi:patatin-like phospholipase/acyl hydrolase
MSNSKYIGLCISGGGMLGILMSGALNYYFMEGKLETIKYWAGTSVGSILITLLSMGYTPLDILAISCEDIIQKFNNFNILTLPQKHGLYSNEILKKFLEEKIILKIGKSPTFSEYYKEFNKYLVIPVYCLSETIDKRKVFCSPDDTPDMKIIDAISLSCNIPLVFEKAIYKGHVYIDGAYTNNFPVQPLYERIEFNENIDDFKILGITIQHSILDVNKLVDYICMIQFIPMEESKIDPKDKIFDIIKLQVPKDVTPIDFKIPSSRKSDLFNDGYFQVKKLFQESQNN